MPNHLGIFCPAAQGILWDEDTEIPSQWGLATFVKEYKESVEFYSGDLNELINQLKLKYHNVWMVGGAEVTKEFLKQQLADEIVVTIVPVLLGGRKLFFDYIGEEYKLHLNETTAFEDGMVELRYKMLKN